LQLRSQPAWLLPAAAQSSGPIKIGAIAQVQSIAAAATPGGAQIAADEINAKGGVMGRKIEIVSYDNKNSSADSVRAFQCAVSDDKISADRKLYQRGRAGA
jgi:branched-chain amino acid transport system substrate-binding protein